MRVFDHPNMLNFRCPFCGTADDKPVVLIGIAGTEEDRIMQAEQFHLDCLDHLQYFKDKRLVAGKTVEEGKR